MDIEILTERRKYLMLCSIDEHGQGLVEYAFILVLVVIGLIIVVAVLGGKVLNMYDTVNTKF